MLVLYIVIAAVGGFALGLWIERMFVWYPFGQHPLTGKESMIGKEAIITMVKPGYTEVRYNSQLWQAQILGNQDLRQGSRVVIRDVLSNRLLVDPIGNEAVTGSA